jgi:hypothetical protein
MLQLPNLPISDNAPLVVGAVTCLSVLGAIVLPQLKNSLALPPSPFTSRPWGHFLLPRK